MIDLKIGDTIRIRKPAPFVPNDFISAAQLYAPEDTEAFVITNEADLTWAKEQL